MKFAVLVLISVSALARTVFAQNSLVLVQAPANQPYTSVQNDTIVIGTSAGAPGAMVTVQSLVPWLTFNAGSCASTTGASLVTGPSPLTLTYCVDLTRILNEGYYVALLQASAQGFAAMRVPVNVTKAPTGDLTATPQTVALTSQTGAMPIIVKADPNGNHNHGGGPIPFTSALGADDGSDGNWLTLTPVSTGPTPGVVAVSVDITKLKSPVDNQPYYKTVVFQDAAGDHDEVTVSLTLTQADLVTRTLIPHFAIGGEYTTGFYILNNSNEDARFQIDFHDDNGAPIALPLSGGLQNEFSSIVPKNGSQYYEFGNPNFPVTGGSALVTAPSTITVQGIFRRHAFDGAFYEASVPTTAGIIGFRTAFDLTTFIPNGMPFYTGLAIANLDDTNPATVTCTSADSSGQIIPNAVTVPVLKPFGHWASYQFPALTGLRGTLDCNSTTMIGVTALRFIGATAFSAVPVIPK